MTGETTRFSLPSALYHSFHSRELYREVGARWRGRAISYLLLLIALAWIPTVAQLYFAASRFQAMGRALVAQVPEITISQGVVSSSVPGPHVLRNPLTSEALGTIDTDGRLQSHAEAPGSFLLTRDALIVRTPAGVTEYDLSKVESFHMDRLRADRWLRFATRWGPTLVYPFLVVGWVAWCLVIALVVSALALATARGFGISLPYPGILSVTIVALTPFVLLSTVIHVLVGSEPSTVVRSLSIVLYAAVTMCYVAFGVAANREDTPAES